MGSLCLAAAPGGTGGAFHDFWVAPSSFRPVVGASVDVSLHVGHLGRHTPYVRNPAHIRRFVAAFSDTLVAVPGTPGRDPAGALVLDRPGLVVVGYHSHATSTMLPAARFEAYLKEEGLDYVSELRSERGESRKPGREAFSRCAKAVLQVGGRGRHGYGRRLGCTLELVPGRNPYEMAPGDSLVVRLLFRGRPLRGARVAAVHASAPHAPVYGRTGPDGRVALRLGQDGLWLIKSVYMLPVVDGAAADWESFWATLTFELPPPS